jgi:chromosome segregation ATPase
MKPVQAAAIAIAILACSCGDPPELVEKRMQQETEITRLKGEISLLEERIANLPADRSEELVEVRARAEEQDSIIQSLETEIAGLESRKSDLNVELENYRRRYKVD